MCVLELVSLNLNRFLYKYVYDTLFKQAMGYHGAVSVGVFSLFGSVCVHHILDRPFSDWFFLLFRVSFLKMNVCLLVLGRFPPGLWIQSKVLNP